MIRARKKSIALIVALVFMLTIIAPMGSAFAASGTSYSALSAPKYDDDQTGVPLGTILVEFNRLGAGVHEAWVELSDGVELKTVNVSDAVNDSGAFVTTVSAVYNVGDSGFSLELTGPDTSVSDVSFEIEITADIEDGAPTGPITATFENINGQLVDGEVTIGYVAGGALKLDVREDNTFSDEGGEVVIRITEEVAGTLNADDELVLLLPDGFEWGSFNQVVRVFGDSNVSLAITPDEDELTITSNKKSSTRTAFDVTLDIVVDDVDADYGEIVAKVKGDYDASPSELVVGAYGDFGVTIEADDSSVEAYAGKTEQAVSDIVIEETLANSLVNGRTILLTLPSNARWVKIDDTSVEDLDVGDVVARDAGVELKFSRFSGTDNRTLRLEVDANSNRSDAAELTIEDIEVALEPGVEGELVVEVAGSAGLSDEIVLAKVVNPVSVSAEKVQIEIGKYGQPAGDIVITEYAAEAIAEGVLAVTLPRDVAFDGTPKVEVTEGDLKIGDVKVVDYNRYDDNQLQIQIDRDSNDASVITISNIKYAVNRVLAEGDIKVAIGGDALVETNLSDGDNEIGNPLDEWEAFFPDIDASAVVVNATCGTPVPSTVTASFTLGDEGVAIQNGRTLVQVNLLCDILGLQKSWDAATKTAYFVKDGKTVAFPMGENAIYVSGVKVPVDQGGVIINDFTYATLRGIQMAFGGELDWDNDTKTATFKF